MSFANNTNNCVGIDINTFVKVFGTCPVNKSEFNNITNFVNNFGYFINNDNKQPNKDIDFKTLEAKTINKCVSDSEFFMKIQSVSGFMHNVIFSSQYIINNNLTEIPKNQGRIDPHFQDKFQGQCDISSKIIENDLKSEIGNISTITKADIEYEYEPEANISAEYEAEINNISAEYEANISAEYEANISMISKKETEAELKADIKIEIEAEAKISAEIDAEIDADIENYNEDKAEKIIIMLCETNNSSFEKIKQWYNKQRVNNLKNIIDDVLENRMFSYACLNGEKCKAFKDKRCSFLHGDFQEMLNIKAELANHCRVNKIFGYDEYTRINTLIHNVAIKLTKQMN